jgi:hypothetical protein
MLLFLGAYGKLRNATICVTMPVRHSVCPYATIRLSLEGFFMKVDISVFLEN